MSPFLNVYQMELVSQWILSYWFSFPRFSFKILLVVIINCHFVVYRWSTSFVLDIDEEPALDTRSDPYEERLPSPHFCNKQDVCCGLSRMQCYFGPWLKAFLAWGHIWVGVTGGAVLSQKNSFRYQWRLLCLARDGWVLSGQGSCPAAPADAQHRWAGE